MLGGGKEVRGRTERCWEEGQRGLGGGVERGWEEGRRGVVRRGGEGRECVERVRG